MCVWCVHGACMIHVWCMHGRRRRGDNAPALFNVRRLVFQKMHNLDIVGAIDHIAENEARVMQLLEQFVHILVVVGQRFVLDAFRPIFKSPFTISETPQTLEEKPRRVGQFGKFFVQEKTWL